MNTQKYDNALSDVIKAAQEAHQLLGEIEAGPFSLGKIASARLALRRALADFDLNKPKLVMMEMDDEDLERLTKLGGVLLERLKSECTGGTYEGLVVVQLMLDVMRDITHVDGAMYLKRPQDKVQ